MRWQKSHSETGQSVQQKQIYRWVIFRNKRYLMKCLCVVRAKLKTDMFGNKVKIKDIRAIITDKSIKWIKFAHLIFIICSVLAQVAIDSAKRTFDIDVNSELKRLDTEGLGDLKEKKKYPGFYADNQNKLKDYKIEETEIDDYILCPMQIFFNILDEDIVDLRKIKSSNTPTYDLSVLFKEQKSKYRDSKQYKKIVSYIKEYDEEVRKEDKYSEGYSGNIQMKFEDCMKKIRKLNINEYTMSSLIKYAFINSDGLCDRMLTILFDYNKERFSNCFINDAKNEKIPDEVA